MAYIGRNTDKLSNVEVLDNITFDGSSSYTLQKNSVNFIPSSANTLLVSIDGVVQAGNFTVSGSTIDFGTAVAGTSTCDFILHYGTGLITTPADGTVTEAKIGTDAVTPTKANFFNTDPGNAADLGNLHIKSADSGASVNSGHNQVVAENSGNSGMSILSGNTSNGAICFGDDGNNCIGYINYAHNGNHLDFGVNNSEAMRIDSGGSLIVGSAGTPAGVNSNTQVILVSGRGTDVLTLDKTENVDANFRDTMRFNRAGTTVGQIKTNNSSTQYNTSSDYRLKENVSYDFDATTRLKQLKPARFNFILNPDITVDGFLAHEVQSVVPDAISGTHNEVDADGNPVYQGIDQSKLVPLLVKTIQELEARITALENA